MTTILEVKKLQKKFADVYAVNGISFAVPAGCCFGLLGPNGAGKTTTIEMIEGISKPDGGEILYRGQPRGNSRGERFELESGIQFQSTALMDYLTTREVLTLFAQLYPRHRPIDELIELCQLQGFLDTFATRLSGGQRQRLLLAVALINDPAILFLDEPTTGLDPQARRNFWQLIDQIKAQGKTILLTTHYMEEAEILCDYLVIMDAGKIIAEGSPSDLMQQHFGHSYVCLDREVIQPHLKEIPETAAIHRDHIALETTSVNDTVNRLLELNIDLNSLQVRNPSLDDLFLKLTGHRLRE